MNKDKNYGEGTEKNNNSHNISKIVAIIAGVIIVLAFVVIVPFLSGEKTNNKKDVTTTVGQNANSPAGLSGEDVSNINDVSNAGKSDVNASNAGKSDVDVSNYWDDVSVYEDAGNSEIVTDKNGETVTESYPGQNEGWSPIVTPDDMKDEE